MKRLSIYSIVLPALILLSVNACTNGSQEPTATVNYRYDMVTYMGFADGISRFEYIGHNDTVAITLLASNLKKPANIKPGQRMLLHYNVVDTLGANVCNIEAQYYNANVVSDSLRVNSKEIEHYVMHPMRLRSLWRTGDYLNVRGEVEYTGKSRVLCLMVDRNTVDCDTVHCYLVHDLLGADNTTYFWRKFYGSFFVGKVWKRKNCRVVRVHFNDEIFPKITHRDFAKTTDY